MSQYSVVSTGDEEGDGEGAGGCQMRPPGGRGVSHAEGKANRDRPDT